MCSCFLFFWKYSMMGINIKGQKCYYITSGNFLIDVLLKRVIFIFEVSNISNVAVSL